MDGEIEFEGSFGNIFNKERIERDESPQLSPVQQLCKKRDQDARGYCFRRSSIENDFFWSALEKTLILGRRARKYFRTGMRQCSLCGRFSPRDFYHIRHERKSDPRECLDILGPPQKYPVDTVGMLEAPRRAVVTTQNVAWVEYSHVLALKEPPAWQFP